MLKRKIRNLAVTGITIASAIVLTVLAATGPSAAVTAAASPGHAAVTTVTSAARLAAAPAGAATTARHVSAPLLSGYFGEIVNYNSIPAHVRLCLGISGNNTNADAVQWPCGTDDQTWYEGAINSAGYYQIYWNSAHGRQCLGVAGGSTAANAQVVGWNCLGPSHPDQYWQEDFNVSKTCLGPQLLYFPIRNYKSGKVLGVAANSYAAGAHVVIYGYQPQARCNNQDWSPDAFGTGT